MIPVGRRDLGVLMGGKNQQAGGKNQRAGQPSAAKDATILSASKPIGSVRTVMASNRPRSLVYNVRKQQHMKMAAGMTSNPDLQLNSTRSQRSSLLHHLNGYHSASQPTSPVKQYSMKSCGVSTGSLPINNGSSSPGLNKQAEMGSLRKFQRQLVDRFRRSMRFHSDDIKNGHIKQGKPTS